MMEGVGRAVFAATLLMIAGLVNIIYGIGALDGANIFVDDQRYILSDLNTMGWVLIVLGAIQITGGFSLFIGNTYGRVIGLVGAGLGAVVALLSIGDGNPWWSLAVFALCVYVVQGILVYGDDRVAKTEANWSRVGSGPRRRRATRGFGGTNGDCSPFRGGSVHRRVM
jgi:hypothetical protein